MAQEFTIKSSNIEDKINQLLPSQGGFQAGVDFSASTMVVPIVDLTETAEGSTKRQDLQTAMSLTTATVVNTRNATNNIINTTGYYRCLINVYAEQTSADVAGNMQITDGTTTKKLFGINVPASPSVTQALQDSFDVVVFLKAGDTLQASSNDNDVLISGSVRQIADVNGNLIDP